MVIQTNKKGLNIFHLENEKELKECPIEDTEQIQFTVDIKYKYPDLLYFHVVNEAMIPVHYRAKLVRKGMLKGVNDIIIFDSNEHYTSLIIELKRQNIRKSTPVSKEQKDFITKAIDKGAFACAAYGADAAMFVVEEYINNRLRFVK